jgi:hypothetical protein
MPRDVSQLLLQVDANVAVAQRNLQQLSRVVASESNNMDQALGKVSAAHGRMTLAGNNSRIALMEVQHVARGAADQFAAGTPLIQIFSQHMAQLGQAAGYAGSSMGKFGEFLGGPWGIALTLATVVLGKLAFGHKDAEKSVGDLVDKMRDQAAQSAKNAQADDIWKHSVEGLTEAIKKQREEQEKALQTDIQTEQAALTAARSNLAEQQRNLQRVAGQLPSAQAELADLKSAPSLAGSAGLQGEAAIIGAQQRVDSLKRQIAQLQTSIAQAEADVRGAEVPISIRNVEERTDKAKAATDAYTRTLGDLQNSLQKGSINQKTFEDRLEAAKRKLDAATASAKKYSNALTGNDINAGQAASIVRGIGGQVNSGTRTHARQQELYDQWVAAGRPSNNPVAVPGASAHETGHALDVQMANGITPAKLREAFSAQGVSLTKIIVEQGHYHIEWGRGAKGDARAAAGEQRADQRMAEKGQREQDNFIEARDRLNQELLAAQVKVVAGIDAQAKAADEQVMAEENRRDQAIRDDLAEGKYGDATSKVAQARAAQLEALNHSVALAKMDNIERQRQIRQLQSQDQDQEQASQFQVRALESQDAIVQTQSEHRALQLQILDLVYQEKEKHLESLKLLAEKNGDLEEANRIQLQINNLPNEKAADASKVRQGTMNPLEAWATSVPQTAAQINEALQSIESQGLDNLSSAIAGVITGTESLKDAFGNLAKSIIADIIQMTVKMLIFKAISGIFGGSSGGGNVGDFNTVMSGGIPGFASGGAFTIGGRGGIDNNVLSINGRARAKVSSDETVAVIPRASSISVPSAANNNSVGPLTINQNFQFEGVAVTRDEFVQGLMATKSATMQAVQEQRRRR